MPPTSTAIQPRLLALRHALVVLLILAYALWYVRLYSALGSTASMLSVIPAIAAAGLFGRKVGLLYMVAIGGLTLGLHNLFARLDAVGLLSSLPGGLALFLVSLVVGSFHDLNVRLRRELAERRRVETTLSLTAAALQQTDRRYRLLFEQSIEAIYLYDPKTLRLHETNSAFCELLGYSMAEAPQLTLYDFVAHPPQEIQANLHNVIELGRLFVGERRWRRSDGRLIDVSVSMSVIRQKEEDVVFVVGRDITERKRAETELANSERQLRTIIEAEPECIKIVVEGGVVEMMNPAGLAMLEADSPDQVIGTLVYRFIAPEDVDVYRSFAERVFRGESGTLEYQVIGLKGTRRWLESYAVQLSSANGHGATLLAVTRDMTHHKRAETQIRRQLERMAALRAIDQAITGSLDLTLTLNVLLDQVLTHLGVHAADILLVDPTDGMLTYTAGRGFRSSAFQQTRLRLGEGRAGRAALERRTVVETEHVHASQSSTRTGLLGRDEFVSYFGVPLIAKGQVLGVFELFHRTRLEPDSEWLEFLEALASQGAIAIENATLFAGLQSKHQELMMAYDATIEGWSRALDLRDKETEGHSRRVTDLSLRLAHAHGISADDLAHMRRGALLHDIGKLGVPDRILLKAEPLTDDEWVIMRQHPTFAYELLEPIAFLQPALTIPYCHHEKWDGSGYPRGLQGHQIPLPARLFAVVDVWDALRSNRPYRPAWPTERVLEHIRSLSGIHFDPQAVDAFLQLVGAN